MSMTHGLADEKNKISLPGTVSLPAVALGQPSKISLASESTPMTARQQLEPVTYRSVATRNGDLKSSLMISSLQSTAPRLVSGRRKTVPDSRGQTPAPATQLPTILGSNIFNGSNIKRSESEFRLPRVSSSQLRRDFLPLCTDIPPSDFGTETVPGFVDVKSKTPANEPMDRKRSSSGSPTPLSRTLVSRPSVQHFSRGPSLRGF